MYLEKLEIQGFKSFAGKNKLVFPGFTKENKRGITAIVGPNGSGKSNIADAVRWALGEQSMKTLRAKMGDDVIFSGAKNKQNMAEVSLYLNNESKKVDIPYSQLIITRRVYRSGENEYLINNSKTKLSEIQMLLARANVGQKTYSVIGQGMVESFLKTTPSERKDFFDEATGIKELQIKREASLNKLLNSHKNLEQAKMIINEIEPRLKNLTLQVNKLQKKGELELELKDLQTRYFRFKWHCFNDKFTQHNQEYKKLEKEKLEKENLLNKLNQDFNKIQDQKGLGEGFNKWSEVVSELQREKEVLIKKLSQIEAQREVNLEQKGNFDISWLESKKKEVQKEADKKKKEVQEIEKSLISKERELKKTEDKKNKTKEKVNKLNQELLNLNSNYQTKEAPLDETRKKLQELDLLLKDTEKLEDFNSLKKGLDKIKNSLKNILDLVSGKNDSKNKQEQEKQKSLKKELNKWQEELERAEAEQNRSWVDFNSQQEKKNIVQKEIDNLNSDKKNIEEKILRYSQKQDQKQSLQKLDQEKEELEKELKEVNSKIGEARKEFSKLTSQEEERKSQLSQLQQKSQSIQKEISELNNLLNQSKVNSTKYKTKLEDLEMEIKESRTEGLEKIKKERPDKDLDLDQDFKKIDKIKNQLSLIGTIDPETEKEYHQTKEKYDFLSEQISDLKKAITSLENIIKELDATIKQKFDKEFKRISQKFEQYFKILFGGGSAKIIKIPYDEIDEENENDEENKKVKELSKYTSTGVAGIDIQVNPPGKKITSLSMLSGGEKALTAIALICAIISSNPSPFVVLDEVDAALDEANSERLAQILEDLANKTQFILITHNRASMHRANVLYGTTMDEKGTSKFLSIKLEDIAAAVKS